MLDTSYLKVVNLNFIVNIAVIVSATKLSNFKIVDIIINIFAIIIIKRIGEV
jgi:hypothetical protein